MPRLSFARRIADTCDAFPNAHPGFATLEKNTISAWKSAFMCYLVEALQDLWRAPALVVSISSSIVHRSYAQDKSNIFGDRKRTHVNSLVAIGPICSPSYDTTSGGVGMAALLLH
eukprot:6188086-Pleurochrysis_carterae.AAC.3